MANVSLKRVQINKANTVMVAATAIAAFVVAFSLVSARALLSKRTYQSHVISKKEAAVDQLDANIQATNSLVNSYKAFISTSSNVIGGNPSGTGDKDGDNAKLILDALPSQYDFPAVTSSLEKLAKDNGYAITSIGGTDDQVAQTEGESASEPAPVPMPFTLNLTTDLDGSKKLFGLFERSIRPFKVNSLTIAANANKLDITLNAQTYYQPGKSLTIKKEVVK